MSRILLPCLILTLANSALAQSASQPADGVQWMSFEAGVKKAANSDKPVLIDIYAPWCGWCTRLQTDVYTDRRVQSYLAENFVVSRLNIDASDDVVRFRGFEVSSAELAMGLGASGTPTTVFLTATGDYITRLPGFVGPDDFVQVLAFIGSEAYLTDSFEDWLSGR